MKQCEYLLIIINFNFHLIFNLFLRVLVTNSTNSYLVGISLSKETNEVYYTSMKKGFSNPMWNEEFLEAVSLSEIPSKTLNVFIYNHSDLREPNLKIFGKVG